MHASHFACVLCMVRLLACNGVLHGPQDSTSGGSVVPGTHLDQASRTYSSGLRNQLDLAPCCCMQGQQVVHCGRRAVSARNERITMVTSYVPADPCLPDRSVLRGPRPVSACPELYYDWATYRLAAIAAQASFQAIHRALLEMQQAMQECQIECRVHAAAVTSIQRMP